MFKLIKVAFLGAIALAFAATAYADFTFVSWGGAYTMSQQKGYIDTWGPVKSGKTKVAVENYNGGLGEVKAQVESGNVKWDVVDILPVDAINGCDEGLFEPLNMASWEKGYLKSIADNGTGNPGTISECAAPQIWWAYTAFYDKAAFPGKKPKNIKDFFDVKKFPGKRGIYTWANALIEMALVADGVKASKVYDVMSTPEGIDRAFAKLDTIKDHVVFWSAGSKPLELVSSGEVVMALAYNGRIGAAILSEGKGFEYIWDATVLEQEYLVAIKGGNEAEALEFMAHASSAESNAEQAKYIPYGPMRKSSIGIIKKGEPWFVKEGGNIDILPHMPTTPKVLKRAVVADPVWWADNGAEIHERFGAWKGS